MEKKQLNLYLETGLINRIKHAAIDEEKRLSDFIADVLESYLSATDHERQSDERR